MAHLARFARRASGPLQSWIGASVPQWLTRRAERQVVYSNLNSNALFPSCTTGRRFSTGTTEPKIDETEEERLMRLKSNPYYVKYQEKLAQADLTKVDDAVPLDPPVDPAVARLLTPSENAPATGRLASDTDSSMKPLDSIILVDKLQDASADEIGLLWTEYHKQQKAIGAVIPADVYKRLRARATECPMFAFPLPRSEGVEFFLLQWRAHQAAFTSLLEWQTHGENAVPYVLLNHYTDFAESKGIVLMTGDLDDNVDLLDAQFLANEIQLYYLGNDAEFELVRQFNHSPETFDYNEILTRLDTMIRAGS